MQIKSIFSRDIERPINGVIKADQVDSKYVELDEYVITKEIGRHFRQFVSTFVDNLGAKASASASSQMGVWISGFFGSGKSHFLKIISYLLENKAAVSEDGRSCTPLEFFLEKVKGDPALEGELRLIAQADNEVILFNIDSKAEQNHTQDSILTVFLKVFNEHVGYCGDHPEIAHMERFLDEKGKYQTFIAALRDDAGMDWFADRDSYHFYAEPIAAALSQVLGQKIDNAEQWIDSLSSKLTLNVENFAKWVREYLDRKGKNTRLIFLVDEVGQFIGGQSKLMLNLQTITEDLGTACNGRAWVIVTSQEDIEAVVGVAQEKNLAHDFSKIQGRFKTRLSLSGSNADEVIQRRLLEKKPEADAALATLFKEKGDILRNQITFKDTRITLHGFRDESQFKTCYPFPPYQFPLVQKIFEASRRSGASGGHLSKGERSMLDAFQTAAKSIQGEDLGALVTLDAFYPAIESYLEGVVKVAIERVKSMLDGSPFDERLLKTLFLVRYIDEIPGNIDNLVTFFVDSIDADKRAIRERIEASLLRLERETLISRNGDVYFFLTNEERDINRDIKTMDDSPSERQRLLGSILFDDILKDLRRYRFPGNGKDFDVARFCDLVPFGNRNEGLVVSIVTPLCPDIALFNDSRMVNQSSDGIGQILIKLRDDSKLYEEIATYLKTDQYLLKRSDNSLPEATKRIHQDKRTENAERRNRLQTMLTLMMEEARYFVLGNEKSFAPPPDTAVKSALGYLVENAFNKLPYIQISPAVPLDEIRRVLADANSEELDLTGGSQNSRALADILNYIGLTASRSQSVNLGALVERYSKHPFGWKEFDTVLLVCRLFKAGQIELSAGGGKLNPRDTYAQVDGPNKWHRVNISMRKSVDRTDLMAVRKLGIELFGKSLPEGEDELYSALSEHFGTVMTNLTTWGAMVEGGRYPGKADIADTRGVLVQLVVKRDPFEYLSHIQTNRAAILGAFDVFQRLETFFTQQRPQWDELVRAWTNEFKPNEFQLRKDAEAAGLVNKINSILIDQHPYGRIKECAPLIAALREKNDALVAMLRADAKIDVEARIAGVKTVLHEVGFDADFSNTCLKPLQDILRQLDHEKSSGQISSLRSQAADGEDDAHAAIQRAVELAKAKAAAPKDNAPTSQPPGVSHGPVVPFDAKPAIIMAPENYRPRRTIKAASLTRKPMLETQADIDEYLQALREVLEKALSENAKIGIE